MSVKFSLRGDTLIEVAFAIAVFAFIAIVSINIMDGGISNSQANLEITMARNEIDAQAEAIRYIHNSFLSERELACAVEGTNTAKNCNTDLLAQEKRVYSPLWFKLTRSPSDQTVTGYANLPSQVVKYDYNTCAEPYRSDAPNIFTNNAFVINTRYINPNPGYIDKTIVRGTPTTFTETPLYPRLLFSKNYGSNDTNEDNLFEGNTEDLNNDDGTTIPNQNVNDLYRYVEKAEGIWVISVQHEKSNAELEASGGDSTPEYFDFHINTCWYAPGKSVPTTIGTIIRLYNPEYVEAAK